MMSEVYIRICTEKEHEQFNRAVDSKKFMPTDWNDMAPFIYRQVVNGKCIFALKPNQYLMSRKLEDSITISEYHGFRG